MKNALSTFKSIVTEMNLANKSHLYRFFVAEVSSGNFEKLFLLALCRLIIEHRMTRSVLITAGIWKVRLVNFEIRPKLFQLQLLCSDLVIRTAGYRVILIVELPITQRKINSLVRKSTRLKK